MTDREGSYRFLLNGAVSTVIFGNEFGYSWEKADEGLYFRKKLTQKVQFFGADYTAILDSAISYKHDFTIEKSDGSDWFEDFTGYFYKTDCDFNADDSTVDVKPETDDGYEDVKKVLSNEYNLVSLAPVSTPLKYKLRPILQIITVFVTNGPTYSNSNILTNIVGLSFWEETLEKDYTIAEIMAAGFTGPALSTSGTYTYKRYLTTKDSFNGVSTDPRPAEDISTMSSFYDKMSSEFGTTKGSASVYLRDTQVETTSFGRALNFEDGSEYFKDRSGNYASGDQNIPVNPTSAWGNDIGGTDPGFEHGGASVWYNKTQEENIFELDNSEELELTDTYKMPDVIQVLLSQETDVLHLENEDYSEFFYSETDPIAGEGINLFVTPKSNIVNAFYTNPARKTPIRLSDVLNLAANSFHTAWHVEKVGSEKRLRIEHISWYERGGSYGEQQVSIDLTQSFDTRLNKPQSAYQNKFNYLKANMPQRYEFAWDNDTSGYFNGNPINVISNEVNTGDIQKADSQNYTPEINNIIARTDISLDGFVLMSTEYSDPDYFVNVKAVEVSDGVSFEVQNGLLSYIILHPNYHRYGKPAEDIEINGEASTALSITRNKQQQVEFVSSEAIDPLHLITTEIGEGQVDKIELNIVSNKYKATINHDTE